MNKDKQPIVQKPVVALLTQHGKQAHIKPTFDQLGWEFIHTSEFDTDTLGTFGGEVTRKLEPLACAQKKALLACELTGAEYGLGSEGSFYPSPYGFGTANLEIIACVHRSGKHIAAGYHEAPFPAKTATIKSPDDPLLKRYLDDLVPGQASMILVNKVAINKGLETAQEIIEQLNHIELGVLMSGVEISFDLRAHLCPVRQKHISTAANELGKKLDSHCPECGQVGFWPERAVPGLPCEWCNQPTNLVKMHVAKCGACGYEQQFPVEKRFASPQYCDYCNP